MDPKLLQTVLPIIIIAAVFALRFRSLNKPRPYKLGWQWVMPLVMALLFGFLLVTLPPTPLGWALLLMGLAIGAFVGIKRGQLMHFERDPISGGLLVRQSPAALIFLFVIMATRRVATPGGGAASPDAAGHIPPAAMLATDAAIGFAFGMLLLLRWTMRQRALAVPAAAPVPVGSTSSD